jgi:hypothetical protein
MGPDEKLLITISNHLNDRNAIAVMLQSFIAEQGPLSEEAASLVRERLAALSIQREEE